MVRTAFPYVYLKRFGCVCYATLPHKDRSKISPTALKCILVGYLQKGYLLWDTANAKELISKDERFLESIPGGSLFITFDTPDLPNVDDHNDSYREPSNSTTDKPIDTTSKR